MARHMHGKQQAAHGRRLLGRTRMGRHLSSSDWPQPGAASLSAVYSECISFGRHRSACSSNLFCAHTPAHKSVSAQGCVRALGTGTEQGCKGATSSGGPPGECHHAQHRHHR